MKSTARKEDPTNSRPGVKSKILVTGADGQLGKAIQQLASRYSQYDFIFLTKQDLPIDQPDVIQRQFSQHHPDYCVNCAAYTAVDKAESEKELAYQVNSEAVEALAAVCREQHCQFIHISTDYVFDGNASIPYTEDAAVNPQSIYGASKLEGERRAVAVNPDTIIIRTSWFYAEFGKNFVRTMLRLMNERDEISVVNDQYGSPTYAADLAEAILQIIETVPTTDFRAGIYHYSNEGIITWYDFALAIKEISGSGCNVNPIPTSQYPTAAKRPAYSALDATKIQKTFGIHLKDWKVRLAVCIDKMESIS